MIISYCIRFQYNTMHNKITQVKPQDIKNIMINLGYKEYRCRGRNYLDKVISDKTISYNINLEIL